MDKLTQKLIETLNESTAFVKTQAPEIAQQILEYDAWKYEIQIYFLLGGFFYFTVFNTN